MEASTSTDKVNARTSNFDKLEARPRPVYDRVTDEQIKDFQRQMINNGYYRHEIKTFTEIHAIHINKGKSLIEEFKFIWDEYAIQVMELIDQHNLELDAAKTLKMSVKDINQLVERQLVEMDELATTHTDKMKKWFDALTLECEYALGDYYAGRTDP
jgi:vacuolar-type H+-ATPase subunit I/STV1